MEQSKTKKVLGILGIIGVCFLLVLVVLFIRFVQVSRHKARTHQAELAQNHTHNTTSVNLAQSDL